MRKAIQLLSLVLALTMLLTTGAYASADTAPSHMTIRPADAGSVSLPEDTEAPTPDPAPPAEPADGEDDLPVSAAALDPSGYDTLTGRTGRETGVPITVGTEVRDGQNIKLNETVDGPGYTALYAAGPDADASVSGSVVLTDDGQSTDACFPSGRGAALVAHDGAALTAEDMQIDTSGFSRAGLVVSDGADAAVLDSQITVQGADPQAVNGEGYVNTPNESVTYTAPWPLGISGGSRAIGLVGLAPSLSLVRTDVTAGGWGALYAGLGRDAAVTAVDSSLAILPAAQGGLAPGEELLGYDPDVYGSGFGLYSAGSASTYLYGSSITGATYGAVLDSAGETYLGASDGTVLLYDGDGLAGSVTGQGQASSIQSVFGFLMTGDAGPVTVDERTAVDTSDATVLYKDGNGAFTFNNARLRSDSGVLLQMMDSDDDGRIGLLNGGYGYSPVYDERDLWEEPGFPGLTYPIGEAVTGQSESDDALSDAAPPAEEADELSVTYTNGLYTGDLYNGTGFCGQPGDRLAVTVGQGAVLNGDICLTTAVKAIPYTAEAAEALARRGDQVLYAFLDAYGRTCQEDEAVYIQLIRYTMDEYFLQGHVQDMPLYNGAASADVTVAEGGVWVVKEASLVTGLTVEDGALVYGQLHDDRDGSLTLTPADEPLEPGVYVSEKEDPAPAEPAETEEPAEIEEPAETEEPAEIEVPAETEGPAEMSAVRPVIFRENPSIPSWKPLTSRPESCIIPIAVWRRSSVG